jgi:AcrR family transcriptional regulator
MEQIVSQLKFKVNSDLYIKDPESSEIGKRLLREAVKMLDKVGFEALTFKRLAEAAQTTESTAYRYFENKHMLILYLSNWYWAWLNYRLKLGLLNIEPGTDKLKKAISILCRYSESDNLIQHIDLVKLAHLIHLESGKIFRAKDVDIENKQGFFSTYKLLNERMRDVILEIDPKYSYPATLANTIIQGIHSQYFQSEHFPSLTNIKDCENDIEKFFFTLSVQMINTSKPMASDGK